ncbi:MULTISPECIES: hypothetical protein [Fictibacillus]|uniref:hypothetical protein n=1 Tax=Fictibacillus TaxID=1329200 RepID=UPI0011A3BFC6|nr:MULTISPECIES: hypothetical protein [Fictibacillus]MBH0170259.1 hypothetical protein [Fictibacillus sp. 18YEL24]
MKKLLVMVVALSVIVLGGCNMLIEDDFNTYLDDRNKLIKKDMELSKKVETDFEKMLQDPTAKEELENTIADYEALAKEAEGISLNELDDLKKSQDLFVKNIKTRAEAMKLSLTAIEEQDVELDEKSYTMLEEAEKMSEKSQSELEKFAEDNNFTLEETDLK